MAWTDDIEQARDNVAALIRDITLKPKPNYTVDNQTYSWSEYLEVLQRQLEAYNRILRESAPFEIISEAG